MKNKDDFKLPPSMLAYTNYTERIIRRKSRMDTLRSALHATWETLACIGSFVFFGLVAMLAVAIIIRVLQSPVFNTVVQWFVDIFNLIAGL